MEILHTQKRMIAGILAVMLMLTVVFVTDTPVLANGSSSSTTSTVFTSTTVTSKVSAVAPTAVKIKWNQVSGAGGYRIWKKTTSSGAWVRVKTVSSAYSCYTITGLNPETTYQFAVRAYKKQSGKYIWTKYQAVSGTTKLSNVTAKVAATSTSAVVLTWNKVPGADKYRVWHRVKGGKWTKLANVSKNTFTYTDKTVSPSTTYEFCVRAYAKVKNKVYWSKLIYTDAVTTPNANKMTTAQKNVLKKILYAVETGGQVYGNQDYTDVTLQYTNSSAEHAITIGAGQWYGTEAKSLLMNIYTKYKSTFQKYDTKNLVYKDLINKSWSTYKLYPKKSMKNYSKTDATKYTIIKNIISSDAGIKCQDALMISQINSYESLIRISFGVTDAKAVAECINILHQGGYSSVKRVLNKTTKPYTLDNIYNAMKTDTGNQVGAYTTRQKKVYTWLNQYM